MKIERDELLSALKSVDSHSLLEHLHLLYKDELNALTEQIQHV